MPQKSDSEIRTRPKRRWSRSVSIQRSLSHGEALVGVIATGVALFIFQMGIRAVLIGFASGIVSRPWYYLPRLLLISFYDFVYSGVLVVLFALALTLLRKRPLTWKSVQVAFLAAALVSLVVAFLDLEFARSTGVLFSYQWLAYSEFLTSVYAHQAIRAGISGALILGGVTLCAGFVALSAGLLRLGKRPALAALWRSQILRVGIVPVVALYLVVAGWYVTTHIPSMGTYDNPIFYFFKSCWAARTNSALFMLKTSVGNDDFLPAGRRLSAPSVAPRLSDAPVRNVILFVMESVGAQYVETFQGKYPVTPTISRYRNNAELFQKIYATAPFSSKALWTMECAMYPWITYETITRACPQITTASLSAELKRRGYRTAFFSSGDNRYQNVDGFLSHRSFDVVSDCNDRTGGHPTLLGVSKEHSDEGCDDRSTVAVLNDWIDQNDGQPFFGMMWTVMTHAPYYPSGPEVVFDQENALENRYLNALRGSDEALGNLMAHLEARGLADSTLVVVVGDHGEAFGQHVTWFHDVIYEECVHVPLLFINPRLFHGENNQQLGGSQDIAPTILDLLGYPLPDAWQGRSLFSANRSPRTYFFEPFGEFWFGFREGDLVFLYEATTSQFKVYDMAKDPMQTRDLAREKRDLLPLATERLAAWVQFQNRYVAEMMHASPSPDRNVAQATHD